MATDHDKEIPAVALSAVHAILDRLNITHLSLEQRLDLARLLDRETHLSRMVAASKTAVGLIEQVEKHLDPFPGQKIQIWKRLFITEMQVHARGAKRILTDALPPLST